MIARLLAGVLLAGACAGDPGSPGSEAKPDETAEAASAGGERPRERTETPQGPPDPMRLLPADVQGIARVDVRALRASAHAQRLQKWLVNAWTPDGSGAARRETKAWIEDVVERTRLVVAGLTEVRGADTRFVAIVRGRYEPGMLVRRATERMPEARVRTRDGGKVVTARGASATALGKRTWVIASEGELEDTLARASRRAERREPPVSRPPLGPLADRLEFGRGTVGAVSRVTEPMRRRMRGSGLRAALRDVDVAGVRVDLAEGLRVRAIGETGDTGAARALIGYAKRKRNELGSNAFVRMFGLDALFRATELERDGTKVMLRMRLNREQTGQLLSMLDGIGTAASSIELREGGGSVEFQWGTDP